MRRARGELIASHPGPTVVVVSHVTPIKTLLRLALDAPVTAHVPRMHLDTASVSIVDYFADGTPSVRLVNDTSHLAVHSLAGTRAIASQTPTASPNATIAEAEHAFVDQQGHASAEEPPASAVGAMIATSSQCTRPEHHERQQGNGGDDERDDALQAFVPRSGLAIVKPMTASRITPSPPPK